MSVAWYGMWIHVLDMQREKYEGIDHICIRHYLSFNISGYFFGITVLDSSLLQHLHERVGKKSL